MATYAAYGQKFEFDNSVPPQAVAQALDHYFTEDPSRKTQISDSFLDAVKQQESGGNSKAVSPKGAQGAYQLMPATAKSYGVTDPTNEAQAREGARKLFADLALKYNGDTDKMLAAYNAGETNINNVVKNNGDNWQKGLTGGLQETAKYIPSVTDKWMGTTSPKAQPTMADQAVTSVNNAIPGSSPIAEAVGSVVAPMIGQVASGYAGLAKLATTGSVDDAANAVRNVQEQSQLHPQTTTGQLAQEGVNAVGTAGTKLLQTPVAVGTGISAAINGQSFHDAAAQVYQDGAGATLAKPLEETGHPALAAIAGAAPEAIGQTVGLLEGEPLLKGASKVGEAVAAVAPKLADATTTGIGNVVKGVDRVGPLSSVEDRASQVADAANEHLQNVVREAQKTAATDQAALPSAAASIKNAVATLAKSHDDLIKGTIIDTSDALNKKAESMPYEGINTVEQAASTGDKNAQRILDIANNAKNNADRQIASASVELFNRKKIASQLSDAVQEKVGNENISVTPILKEATEQLDRLTSSGEKIKDPAAIKFVSDLINSLKSNLEHKVSPIVDASGKQIVTSTGQELTDNSFASIRGLKSDLYDKLYGNTGLEVIAKGNQDALYSSLTKATQNALKEAAIQKGASAEYAAFNKYYKDNVMPYKNFDKTIRSSTPDTATANISTGQSINKTSNFNDLLEAKGKAAQAAQHFDSLTKDGLVTGNYTQVINNLLKKDEQTKSLGLSSTSLIDRLKLQHAQLDAANALNSSVSRADPVAVSNIVNNDIKSNPKSLIANNIRIKAFDQAIAKGLGSQERADYLNNVINKNPNNFSKISQQIENDIRTGKAQELFNTKESLDTIKGLSAMYKAAKSDLDIASLARKETTNAAPMKNFSMKTAIGGAIGGAAFTHPIGAAVGVGLIGAAKLLTKAFLENPKVRIQAMKAAAGVKQ